MILKRLSLLVVLMAAGTAALCAPVDTVSLWSGVKDVKKSKVLLLAHRPENPNGISVIICPGGSYHWLDDNGEGSEVARWLNSYGITAFVLHYRTAGVGEFIWHTRVIFRGVRHPDMISDAQRALQWVSSHADDYSLDRDRIGMMGFSAGGHLVMSAACFSTTDFLKLSGIENAENMRPAFVAPVYPVVTMQDPYAHRRSRRGLLGDNRQGNRQMRDSLSLENHIPADCPPVFLTNCKDDPIVPYMNSVLLDSALTAAGIDHKYILYETGKHGFGVSDYYGSPESREWKYEFLSWLKAHFPDSFL